MLFLFMIQVFISHMTNTRSQPLMYSNMLQFCINIISLRSYYKT